MKPCDAFAESISAMQDGELPPDAERELLRHLQDCAGCRARLARFQLIDTALRAEQPGARDSAPQIARPRIVKRPAAAARRRFWWRSSAAAAALLALTATAILVPSAADAAWPIEPAATLDVLQTQDRADQTAVLKTLELELRAMHLEVRILELESGSVGDVDHKIRELLDRVNQLQARSTSPKGTRR